MAIRSWQTIMVKARVAAFFPRALESLQISYCRFLARSNRRSLSRRVRHGRKWGKLQGLLARLRTLRHLSGRTLSGEQIDPLFLPMVITCASADRRGFTREMFPVMSLTGRRRSIMVTARGSSVMAMMPSFSTQDAGARSSKQHADVDNLKAGVKRSINDGIDDYASGNVDDVPQPASGRIQDQTGILNVHK